MIIDDTLYDVVVIGSGAADHHHVIELSLIHI